MNDNNLSIIIMAGGSGERFWPFSRSTKPKQLINIIGEKSLISQTVERCAQFLSHNQIYVVTTKELSAATKKYLPELPEENIIAEPYGRNTAPCIALISALFAKKSDDHVVGVIPADHWIPDKEIYAQTMQDAATVAREKNCLVTIGIKPTAPETGYGYILAGEKINANCKTVFSNVNKFIEKPEKEKAENLIAKGNSFWNAGMFVFKPAIMLNAFKTYLPDFYKEIEKIISQPSDEIINEVYVSAPAISIDYAIMEVADNVIVAHGEFNWDDVGSWSSVANHWQKDNDGTAARGDFFAIDSKNCVIGNEDDGIVAVLGMEDVIVVRTKDAVLVCPKSRAQDVKKIVQKLKEKEETKKYT